MRSEPFNNYLPPTPMNNINVGNNSMNPNPPPRPSGLPLAGRPTIESIIDARRSSNPTESCFSIPKTCVGAVIGKGGQNLRELQSEYGVRVYIEKEDFNGKRMVVLSYAGNPDNGVMDPQSVDMVVRKCQQQIERIVEDQLKSKSNDHSLENLSVA